MKLFLGLFLGVIIGIAATWFFLSHHPPGASKEEPKKEAPHEPEHAEEGVVKLDKNKQAAAGIETAQPKAAQFHSEIKGYGRVLDPAPIIGLVLDVQSGQAALQASTKDYERVKTLFAQNQNASARSLETAEAALKRDQILLNTAQSKLQTALGPALVGRDDLPQMIESFSKLDSALVRIDLPPDQMLGSSPTNATISPIANPKQIYDAQFLGRATTADLQFQGQAFLLLLRTNALPPNTAVIGYLPTPGPEINGFLVPSKAVLQDASDVIVFVQQGEENFKRTPIAPERTTPEGLFVTNGIKAEDRIVISGAQEILSETHKGSGEE
jgi:hypothetical protein